MCPNRVPLMCWLGLQFERNVIHTSSSLITLSWVTLNAYSMENIQCFVSMDKLHDTCSVLSVSHSDSGSMLHSKLYVSLQWALLYAYFYLPCHEIQTYLTLKILHLSVNTLLIA